MTSTAYSDCETLSQVEPGTPPTFEVPFPRNESLEQSGELAALQPRQALFVAGERKNEFYRVEAGALLISTPAADGSLGGMRLVFPGEYIGLGFLSEHHSSARAIVASTISSYPLDKLEEASEHSPALQQQLHEAVQSEFEQLRNKSVAIGFDALPIVRVANFLVVASHIALLEGRSPNLASDDITPARLAGPLNLDNDLLIGELNKLKNDQLIDFDLELRVTIVDLERLVAFASRQSPTRLAS